MSRRGVNPLFGRFAQPGPRLRCQVQYSQSTLHIPHSALPPSHATLRFQLSPPYPFRYASLCTLSAPPFTIRFSAPHSRLYTLHAPLLFMLYLFLCTSPLQSSPWPHLAPPLYTQHSPPHFSPSFPTPHPLHSPVVLLEAIR
jgi:hypothetical protein